MKLQRIFALTLMMGTLLPVSTAFVACDADDIEDVVDNSAAAKAKGDYLGTNAVAVEMRTLASTMKMPMGQLADFEVEIAQQGTDKVNIKLDDYEINIADPRSAFKTVQSKELLLKGIGATLNNDGTISLQGDLKGQEVQMVLQAMGSQDSALKTMTINKGTATGTIATDGTLTLSVSFQPGTMPFPLVYDITAKRK